MPLAATAFRPAVKISWYFTVDLLSTRQLPSPMRDDSADRDDRSGVGGKTRAAACSDAAGAATAGLRFGLLLRSRLRAQQLL